MTSSTEYSNYGCESSSERALSVLLVLQIFLGTLAGGGAGLVWGGLIGALIHERTVVYLAASPTVCVMALLAPNRAGVMLAARF